MDYRLLAIIIGVPILALAWVMGSLYYTGLEIAQRVATDPELLDRLADAVPDDRIVSDHTSFTGIQVQCTGDGC